MESIIYKYALLPEEPTLVALPAGAQVLSVGVRQLCDIAMWVKFAPQQRIKEVRKFVVVPTGHTFDEKILNFIGTVTIRGWVGHVFEVVPE